MKLLSDHAPGAIKERPIEQYFSRIIAVDSSMALYQFMIAVRSGPEGDVLTNEAGEVTSHLQGLFYRTIRLLENGVKPIFVFDGKPPVLKGGELDKRREKREQAEAELKEAKENEDQEEVEKFSKRLVKITKEHNEEARRLLKLMGIPIVESPSEAEAQCAALQKAGKCFATATEDMDALTFGSGKLVRHMTFSAARAMPIVEIDLQTVLKEMKLEMQEFIDLCILCGCDYTGSIKGIGPQKALALIQEHKTIEQAIKKIDKEKYKIPDDFLFKEAHELFENAEVADPQQFDFKWVEPDEDGIIQFLVTEKGFNLDRVHGALKRLKVSRGKASQMRMDGFFKSTAPPQSQVDAHEAALKRKREAEKAAKSAAKGGLQKGKKAAASAANKKAKV
jgi:flap endonuclease-1